MVQWTRAPNSVAMDLGLNLSTHSVFTTICNSRLWMLIFKMEFTSSSVPRNWKFLFQIKECMLLAWSFVGNQGKTRLSLRPWWKDKGNFGLCPCQGGNLEQPDWCPYLGEIKVVASRDQTILPVLWLLAQSSVWGSWVLLTKTVWFLLCQAWPFLFPPMNSI